MEVTNPPMGRHAGQVAASLAVACIAGHVPMLFGHFAAYPKTTLLMAAVAALCVPCIRRLWTAPTRQDLVVAGCLATVMLGIHLCLMMAMAAGPVPDGVRAASHHHHGAPSVDRLAVAADAGHDHAMHLDEFFYVPTALAAVQIVYCTAVLIRAGRLAAPVRKQLI